MEHIEEGDAVAMRRLPAEPPPHVPEGDQRPQMHQRLTIWRRRIIGRPAPQIVAALVAQHHGVDHMRAPMAQIPPEIHHRCIALRTGIQHPGAMMLADRVERQPPTLTKVRFSILEQAQGAVDQPVSASGAVIDPGRQYPLSIAVGIVVFVEHPLIAAQGRPLDLGPIQTGPRLKPIHQPIRGQLVDVPVPYLVLTAEVRGIKGVDLRVVGAGDPSHPGGQQLIRQGPRMDRPDWRGSPSNLDHSLAALLLRSEGEL
ncbi:hypothetical protein EDC61_10668 [Sulfuritortus calidifontis]|uniref:Uncharacterized protein n=1 Tax=Sulfuritortus calidifontis TaxID=1914471 RepID=A0A4R3JVP0_9PROT|nr:hypothetical protein EDC61_10668 [Sulfuritortus calidifontis]